MVFTPAEGRWARYAAARRVEVVAGRSAAHMVGLTL